MKWRDMVHGCMVYTERAETAAVSRGTSHVTIKQRCKYTTSADVESKTRYKNKIYKKASHSFSITCDMSTVSLLETQRTALYESDQ